MRVLPATVADARQSITTKARTSKGKHECHGIKTSNTQMIE